MKFAQIALLLCLFWRVAFSQVENFSEGALSGVATAQYLYERGIATLEVDQDSSRYYFDAALEIYTSLKYKRYVADCMLQKSKLARRQGQYVEALSLADSAYTIYSELQDSIKMGRSQNAMGLVYFSRAEYATAYGFFNQAITSATQVEDTLGLLKALNNLSLIYGSVEDYSQMKAVLLRIIELSQAAELADAQMHASLNLGNTYNDLGQVDSARHYYEASYMLAEQFGLPVGNSLLSLNNLVNLHIETGEMGEAGKYVQQVKMKLENMLPHESTAVAYVYGTLTDYYYLTGDLKQSENYLSKNCELSYMLNFLWGIANCEEDLSRSYKDQGQWAAAMRHMEKYHALKDSMSNQETVRRISAIQLAEQLGKKDTELASILQLQQQESEALRRKGIFYIAVSGVGMLLTVVALWINRLRTQARVAFQEKVIAEGQLAALRAQMNPHFIYNAFNSIQNYVLKSERMEAYNYLNKFARLIRQIVTAASHTFISLDEELNMLTSYIELEQMRFRNSFDFSIVIDDTLRQLNPQIPAMMIQPHVENAILHGLSNKGQGGLLKIEMASQGGGLVCVIEDNGIGRRKAAEIKEAKNNLHLSIATENGRNRLEFLRKIGYFMARVEVTDLGDEQSATGMQVSIFLPFKAR